MKTLYSKIAPFLRKKNPKTAQEAEGKTDTLCGALKLALRSGAITQQEHDYLIGCVHRFLERYLFDPETGSVAQVVDSQNWWPNMRRDTPTYAEKLQGYRHSLLQFWCLFKERADAVR